MPPPDASIRFTAQTVSPTDMLRILLLEDNPIDADLVERYLEKDGIKHVLDRVDTREGFELALAHEGYDLILADYALPAFDGIAALLMARDKRPELPFIFVSGALGEERAVESLKLGATDYVMKTRLQRLPQVVSRALAEAAERTARRRSEDRQRLLVAELNHRVKNTLATVISLASQTIATSETMAAFDTAFNGRLRALADAHSLLSNAEWESTDLDALIGQVIRPHIDGGTVHRSGPAVLLWPQAALTLSLVFHELAVNAAKYGALSTPGGQVDVDWTVVGGEPELRIGWSESGGPTVIPPARRSFGLVFIERSVAYELEGKVVMEFPPSGALCRIAFPLNVEAGPLTPR